MTARTILAAVAALTVLAGPAYPQQQTDPHARAAAVLQALRSGDAGQYEAAAQANMSQTALARRTPQERAALLARFAGDFGHFGPAEVTDAPEGLRAIIHGLHGQTATLTFTFESAPDHRIAGLAISVEAGQPVADRGPQLPPPPISASMSAAEMQTALDGWFAPMTAHDDFAGVVLIARNGEPFAIRAYGVADRQQHTAIDANTAFNIASIGKKLTQTAIARLIQDGRISMTDTVGDLLPDYPNEGARSATIAQLINMQGGISDFFGPAFDAAPKAQFTTNHAYYNFVSHLPQHFTPGSQTEYCNGCYIVLGEIVERVSGIPFEQFIQQNVFSPAGMTRSAYINRTRPPPNTANTYTRQDQADGAYVSALERAGYSGSGAGGVYSTAGDLLRFDAALRSERLLNSAMTAWVLNESPPTHPHNGAIAVAGGSPGTNALLDSDGHWTVIVVSNVDPPMARLAGEALARALRQ